MAQDDPFGEEESSEQEQTEEFRKILDKIKDREKEFSDGWWKDAEAAVKLYDGDRRDSDSSDQAYNILYSNTEVLVPSLYSATPKPDVRTRYKGMELKPIPEVVERFLTVVSDSSNPGTESLDNAMSETVLESLVAGMGFARLRHYPDRTMPICIESGHYKGLIWGKARKWAKVPWIAFRLELTKEELFKQFGIEEEDEGQYSPGQDDETTSQTKSKASGTIVYEYWEKASGKIYFLCEDWKKLLLTEGENTLQLEGFYPTPGPLTMTQKPGKIEPIPLYQYYRNQAEELNRVTVRLNKVLSAIRVRGAYNGMLGDDLQKLLASDELENALIPASEASMLAAMNGGFDRHIWMLPIENLVNVATQLYQARQQIKQVIYELTGISDIIRGSSVASETATAQDLKNKWGTIRLRKMQTLVADYVRDLYRLSVDGASQCIPPEQWKMITQLPIPMAEEKKAAIIQLQQMVQQAQGLIQQATSTGQQPPQIPPPPKALLQAAQSPSWEEILPKIQNDANRAYTINVQTSSTIDLDTASDKQDVTEFMSAVGQLANGLQPIASIGPTGLEAAKQILIAVCSRFKFGLEIVDSIKAIEPQPQGPNPAELQKLSQQLEEEKKKLEEGKQKLKEDSYALQEQELNLRVLQKEIQADIKLAKADMRVAAADMQADMQVNSSQQKASQATFAAQQQARAAQQAAKMKPKAPSK